jgi:hypothetical protein
MSQPFIQSEEAIKEEGVSPFAADTTFTLVKKLAIYKMMGSNLFINYSLMGIKAAYKVLGVRLTNFAIENTAGTIFTGGVNMKDVSRCTEELKERNIGTVSCYVVEGVRNVENAVLDDFLKFSIDSVNEITKDGEVGHFAMKLTAFISTELMEKLSLAQDRFVNDICQVNFDAADDSVLSEEQLMANLAKYSITDYER